MTNGAFMSEYKYLGIVAALSAVAVLISTLESLSLSAQYRNEGLFSWKLHRLRSAGIVSSPLINLYDPLFRYPNILALLGVRVALCIAVLLCLRWRSLLFLECGAIGALSVLFSIRGVDGKNGADQLTKITFLSLAFCLISPNAFTWRCELVFLTAQLFLAYTTAGFLKLKEPTWRDGTALLVVLRQNTYGNRMCWHFARQHVTVTRLLAWSVIIFECTFPLVFLIPSRAMLFVLALGVVFHIANAAIIGLNTFLWAFVAIYPAVAWCTMTAHRVISHMLR